MRSPVLNVFIWRVCKQPIYIYKMLSSFASHKSSFIWRTGLHHCLLAVILTWIFGHSFVSLDVWGKWLIWSNRITANGCKFVYVEMLAKLYLRKNSLIKFRYCKLLATCSLPTQRLRKYFFATIRIQKIWAKRTTKLAIQAFREFTGQWHDFTQICN